MKWFMLFLVSFTLCSCTSGLKNPEAIDAVNASVAALEQSLPKECKTQSIMLQFTAIKKETEAIKKDYEVAVSKVNSEKIKWKTGFFGLLLLIGFWLFRKLKGF